MLFRSLCSWSSHTPLQQTAILLGSSPPKLLRKHDKAWTHSTSTTCTQLIYSLQSHFFKHQPSASPGPAHSLTSSLPVPSLMIHSVRCVTAPLTRKKCFSVTYVTPAGIWTASSPNSLPSLPGYENVPCVPLLPPYAAVPYDTSASPLPSLTLTVTKHHLGKKKEEKKKRKPPILRRYNVLLSTPQLWRRSRFVRRKERLYLTTHGVDSNINHFLSRERTLTPHPHTRL